MKIMLCAMRITNYSLSINSARLALSLRLPNIDSKPLPLLERPSTKTEMNSVTIAIISTLLLPRGQAKEAKTLLGADGMRA